MNQKVIKLPYIKLLDRDVFKPAIQFVLNEINNENELISKCEIFGDFVYDLSRSFADGEKKVAKSKYKHPVTGDVFVKDCEYSAMENTIGNILQQIDYNDLFSSAGKLNYVISAILWGMLGDSIECREKMGGKEAGYGMRSYVASLIEKVKLNISVNMGKVPSYDRPRLIMRGVLSDVLLEVYRRRTASYEDRKMGENSDIWYDGGHEILGGKLI